MIIILKWLVVNHGWTITAASFNWPKFSETLGFENYFYNMFVGDRASELVLFRTSCLFFLCSLIPYVRPTQKGSCPKNRLWRPGFARLSFSRHVSEINRFCSFLIGNRLIIFIFLYFVTASPWFKLSLMHSESIVPIYWKSCGGHVSLLFENPRSWT